MRAALVSLAVSALAAPQPVAEQRFAADADGLVGFRMPSGNIACLFVPIGGAAGYAPLQGGPELACDRLAPAPVRLRLGPSGPAALDTAPAAGCCEGPVLAYGNTWSLGPFACAAETTGLTCRREDGRGFALARAGIAVF